MSVARRTIGSARNPALDAWIADDGSFTRPARRADDASADLDLTDYPVIVDLDDGDVHPMMRPAPDGFFTRVAIEARDARTRIEIAILLLAATAFLATIGRCALAAAYGWRP